LKPKVVDDGHAQTKEKQDDRVPEDFFFSRVMSLAMMMLMMLMLMMTTMMMMRTAKTEEAYVSCSGSMSESTTTVEYEYMLFSKRRTLA